MPIFHKILFKHIFHKKESLFMFPKRKFICMLKRKFCVATEFLIFNNYNFVCLRVFLSFLSFTLKIRVKSSFSHPVLGRSRCRLSNSTAIFLPNVSDIWRWPNPVKIPNVPFFLLQNPQWSPIINSHEQCI